MARINVTKSFLPPLEEYEEYLEQIWESAYLTNQGPLLQKFEQEVEEYLGVQKLHFLTNGTTALQLALHALDITEGEVITTPFSYVATTSSIMWERCEPVFVDIEPRTFCIDPDKIEAAITDRTKAIMPTHVFGYPCDIKKIDEIAKKHKLRVIYDAAHAFGVEYDGESLMSFGDISVGSFHATKVFHTIEGGCIIARDDEINAKVELMKRFGHNGDMHYMLGINAKASEFNAAMGLCNLKYVDEQIKKRRVIWSLYDDLLANDFRVPVLPADTKHNYAYYPLLLSSEAELLRVLEVMMAHDIHPRRYFYPSLNALPYVAQGQGCPVSEDIATRIVCLPLYPDLQLKDVERICVLLKSVQHAAK